MGEHFKIKLLGGRMLKDTSTFGVQSPFVLMQMGKEERRSSICKGGGVAPEWNEVLNMPHDSDTILHIVVRNKGFLRNELIGKGKVDLQTVLEKKEIKLSVPLTTRDKRSRGELTLEVVFASMCIEKDLAADFSEMKITKRNMSGIPTQIPRINEEEAITLPIEPPLSPYINSSGPTNIGTVPYPRVPAAAPPTFPGSFGSSADSAGSAFMASRENLSFPSPDYNPYSRADINGQQAQAIYASGATQEEAAGDRGQPAVAPHISYKERQDAYRPNSRMQPSQPAYYPGSFYVGENNSLKIPYLTRPLVDDENEFDTV